MIWTPEASKEFEAWIAGAPYGNRIADDPFTDDVLLLVVERGCEYVKMWVRPPLMVRRADGAVRLVDWADEGYYGLVVDTPSAPVHRRFVSRGGMPSIRGLIADELFDDEPRPAPMPLPKESPIVYVSDSVPPEDGRFR